MTYFADWPPAIFYLVLVPLAGLALCLLGMWLVDVLDPNGDWHD